MAKIFSSNIKNRIRYSERRCSSFKTFPLKISRCWPTGTPISLAIFSLNNKTGVWIHPSNNVSAKKLDDTQLFLKFKDALNGRKFGERPCLKANPYTFVNMETKNLWIQSLDLKLYKWIWRFPGDIARTQTFIRVLICHSSSIATNT